MGTKRRGETYNYINIIAVIACFAVIVIILTVLFADSILGGGRIELSSNAPEESSYTEDSLPQSTPITSEDESSYEEESSVPIVDSMQFTQINVTAAETARGDLILVNDDLPFDFEGVSNLVNMYEKRDSQYKLAIIDIDIEQRAMDAFNEMIKGFYAYSGLGSVTVNTGYRTFAQQQSIYNGAADKSTVSVAGGSDYHTGLSVGLSVYPASDGAFGSGKFLWLKENCSDYGFILRYPEGSSGITGLPDSERIFRYVGKPHAYFIDLNGLTLEEYLAFLKNFNQDQRYSGIFQGETYEIYYQAANSNGTLSVPVDYEYTYSGDNQNGFIVTVKKG